MSDQDMDSLKKEITSLNKQLVLLGEARNKEILDLQRRFADQIRELQHAKGLDNVDEITNLNKKIEDLENALTLKDKEIENLKSTNIDLEKKLKNATEQNEKVSLSLEKARFDALKAQSEAAEAKKLADESNNKKADVDYEEMLKPFEDQLEKLKEIITKQNSEILGLRNLVHEECTERMRLQKLISQQQQVGQQKQVSQQQVIQQKQVSQQQVLQQKQVSQQQQDVQQQSSVQQQQRDQAAIYNRARARSGRNGGSRLESKIVITQPNRNTSRFSHLY